MPTTIGNWNSLEYHPHYRKIIEWFSPGDYISFHKDLEHWGPPHFRYEEALYHYCHQGFLERRIYCPQLLRHFDPEYYRAQLSGEAKDWTQYELRQHWVYIGVFDGLAANTVTAAALSSKYKVFNMGRVGSYTVVDALKAAGTQNIIHTHTEAEFGSSYQTSSLRFPQLIFVQSITDKRPKSHFITGVRDPMDFAISSVKRTAQMDPSRWDVESKILGQTVAKMMKHCLEWFDHNYHLNINPYDFPFDADAGYGIIQRKEANILLYRTERMNELEPIFRKFTGVPHLTIAHSNSSKAHVAQMVDSALSQFSIPPELVEMAYSSRFARHFLNAAERDAGLKRWLTKD